MAQDPKLIDLDFFTEEDFIVLFAPEDPASKFRLLLVVPENDDMEMMRRKCTIRGGEMDGTMFYDVLATHMVKGWAGLTPEEIERCGLAIFKPGKREELEKLLGGPNRTIQFSEQQLTKFVRGSRRFRQRLDALSGDLALVKHAMETARLRNLANLSDGESTGPN